MKAFHFAVFVGVFFSFSGYARDFIEVAVDPASNEAINAQMQLPINRAPEFLSAEELEREESSFLDILNTHERASQLKQKLDWGSLFALNMQAAHTWQKLSYCFENNFNLIRKSYLRADINCHGDRNLTDQVLGELNRLHANFENLVLTTSLYALDKEDRNALAEILAVRGGLSNKPLFHPLFVQVLLEHQATMQKVSTNFLKAKHEFSSGFEKNYSNQFYFRAAALSKPKTRGQAAEFFGREFDMPKKYLNSFLLFGLVLRVDSCTQIGLWPDYGAVLSKVIAKRNFGIGTMYSIAGSDGTDCNLFGREARDISYEMLITEYRALADRYGLKTERRYKCIYEVPEDPYCVAYDPNAPFDLESEYAIWKQDHRTEKVLSFETPQLFREIGYGVRDVTRGATDIVKDIGSGIGDVTREVSDTVKDISSGIGDVTHGATGIVKDISSGVGDVTREVADTVKDIGRGVADFFHAIADIF